LQESFISKLFKFHSIAALSGATNYGVFIMLISIFTINDLVANLFGILLGAILNYLINSNWTWRKFD
jgi:putative flippase GtrA